MWHSNVFTAPRGPVHHLLSLSDSKWIIFCFVHLRCWGKNWSKQGTKYVQHRHLIFLQRNYLPHKFLFQASWKKHTLTLFQDFGYFQYCKYWHYRTALARKAELLCSCLNSWRICYAYIIVVIVYHYFQVSRSVLGASETRKDPALPWACSWNWVRHNKGEIHPMQG